jgi:hypothetical protein
MATVDEEDNDCGGTARDGSNGQRTTEGEDGSGGCEEEGMAAWQLLLWMWETWQLSLFFMAIEHSSTCISLIACLELLSQCTKIPIKPFLFFSNLVILFSTLDLCN